MQLKRNRKIEFERLKQNHKKQIVIWALAICIIGGALTFATTRAKYRLTESIPLAQGIVNYNPDKIAPTISNITSSTTETTINVTVEASDNVGVTEYWYCKRSFQFCNYVKGTGNTYQFTGLSAGSTYTIQAYVKDAAGNQSDTITKSITTSDTTKPTISNVTSSVTETTIKITVTASDNVGVTEYWYQIGNNAAIKSTSNTYTFTGLKASTTYSVKVYVKDAASNQSTTTTKNVTTITKSEEMLAKLNIINYKTTAPDFSKIATTDEGVYRVSDGMYGGYSYYFRGAVTNNYVKFANKCWRIVRINGNGTLRLIYDGSSCHANGTSTTNSIAVSNQKYSTSGVNRSYYVGWHWAAGVQRPSTTSLGTNSNAKSQLQTWYNSNLKNYASNMVYGNFCNDRNAGNGYSWYEKSTFFQYAATTRLNNYTPSLECNKGDTYSEIIGLITADEVMYAGGVNTTDNNLFYLYNGQNYWTMSPSIGNGPSCDDDGNCAYVLASVWMVTNNGGLNSAESVGLFYGIRPVINLKSDITFSSGNGTQSNPYVVS